MDGDHCEAVDREKAYGRTQSRGYVASGQRLDRVVVGW
jgi:hypothetical protein